MRSGVNDGLVGCRVVWSGEGACNFGSSSSGLVINALCTNDDSRIDLYCLERRLSRLYASVLSTEGESFSYISTILSLQDMFPAAIHHTRNEGAKRL